MDIVQEWLGVKHTVIVNAPLPYNRGSRKPSENELLRSNIACSKIKLTTHTLQGEERYPRDVSCRTRL